jgi:hypothetical protein
MQGQGDRALHLREGREVKTGPAASEKVLTGCWHAALFLLHLREIRLHGTRRGKLLCVGAALWHLDATINDFRGTEAYLKRGLRKLVGGHA